MDETAHIPMTPLDCIVSDDHMQMLKTILPYLPPAQAKLLAILTKWQELTRVLEMYPDQTDTLQAMSTSLKPPDETQLLDELKLYGGKKGKQLADGVTQMLDMFQLISLMQVMDSEKKEEDNETCMD